MSVDDRCRLPEGYRLSGGTKETYVIEKYVNAGANSVVYQAWYKDSLMPGKIHTVMIKELYPLDPTGGGIIREPDMSLTVRPESQAFFEKHRKSFVSGNNIHLMLSNEGKGGISENLDSFEQNHTLYTVLNIRAGQVLEEVIQKKQAYFSLTEAVRLIRNLLLTVRRFHTHELLHLDVSPDNIFLLQDAETGEKGDILLLDFNSVYSVRERPDSLSAYCMGKAGYLAPEVKLRQEQELGPWTDLYAVTAVFYYILTDGEAPQDMELQQGKELVSAYSRILLHEKEVSARQVNEILRKGFRVLPRNRYQSVEEMLEDVRKLEDILSGVCRIPVTEWKEEQTAAKGKRGEKQRRRVRTAAAVLAAAVAVGGAYYAGRQYRPPMENTELDLSKYPLETDETIVLTEQNVRYPLSKNGNILKLQVQGKSAVRVLLKEYTHERNLSDAFASYSIFTFYAGENDKRGWQNAGMTYDFFYTDDNSLHMELPLQDENDFRLDYVGVIFQNFNYDESAFLLDINRCTLVDGAGNAYELTELLGSHLLFFDEKYWQQNVITEQNQEYVETFADIRGGKLLVDVTADFLEPLLQVEFSSDNPQVATIDERGRIQGHRQGVATITVKVTDRKTGEKRSTQMLVHVISKL